MSKSQLARVFVTLVTVSGTSLASSSEQQGPPGRDTDCVFAEHHVRQVVPYQLHAHTSKPILHQLGGVEIFIEAEAGLTSDGLRQDLARHVRDVAGKDAGACVLDVPGIDVHVRAADGGFWVRVTAHRLTRAAEVLHRARLLMD